MRLKDRALVEAAFGHSGFNFDKPRMSQLLEALSWLLLAMTWNNVERPTEISLTWREPTSSTRISVDITIRDGVVYSCDEPVRSEEAFKQLITDCANWNWPDGRDVLVPLSKLKEMLQDG